MYGLVEEPAFQLEELVSEDRPELLTVPLEPFDGDPLRSEDLCKLVLAQSKHQPKLLDPPTV